ncbi:MAG: aminotransferase class I/II-fold pyridoxal phosphate-dependent enzyme [Desulfobacterales bacterium]|nr:aminotransferase class I/II-fold pyridoxal phosphate-dependent enzyme [Desulfobacterales bacterium]
MNPIAQELNAVIKKGNSYLMEMLSKTGRRLYFPKGILSQSAEARQKAYDKFNATIGIATENLRTMCLPSVMSYINDLRPSQSLTYAPSFGIPALRHEWRESMVRKNPSLHGKAISLPVVTNGITHGISVFSDMFIDPDDVLIFPDKMWGNNVLIMSVRGDAQISTYPLFSNGGFNTEGFEARIRQEAENNYKVVVFLNFPNNPTGYTVTEKEGERIVEILTRVAEEGTNVIAVTDDAYFGLNYEEEPVKESLFARLCDCHPRLLAVKLDGATKEIFVWGLRIGFITYGTKVEGDALSFYEALEKKTAGNIRGTVSNASHLSQSVVLKAILSPEIHEERETKVEILKKRANKVKEVLADPKYDDVWEIYPFNSGYFMCLKLKTVDAETLRLHLLDKYKVGLISIGKTDLRIAFSSVDEENIEELFEYIYKGVKDIED